ncbi:cytochrome P450 [Viridothelium virens]|uniref:Cytochrome P450 n=1 Tax=Viridothelium virens TaxID=1048519 RepID=A0A6A6GZ31_VIRVR|nr:cytochrome P450 [Viridothelium virens]
MPILDTWAAIISLFVIYCVSVATYRLFFHPLAKFPGPKLAAVTKWYEFYFDILKQPGGTFFIEIERMHEIYGPIIRINPDEIHVRDSSWVEVLEIGPTHGVRDKYPPAPHMAGTPDGIFGTIPHRLHRQRRAVISSFFSKASVASKESRIHVLTEQLFDLMRKQFKEKGYADMRIIAISYTTDVLCDVCLDYSMNLLKEEQRGIDWYDTIHAVAMSTPLVKQFTWIMPLVLQLPDQLITLISRQMSRIVHFNQGVEEQAKITIRKQASSAVPANEAMSPRSIFHSILFNPNISPDEQKPKRMAQEGFGVVGTGGETTGRIVTTAMFFLLEKKSDALERLKRELAETLSQPGAKIDLKTLERLPWLTAVIKETLRIAPVLTSRLPVVSPDKALRYRDWNIPPGVAVSITLRDILLDPAIFEDPMEFKPERWLPENPELDRISRYYLPFSCGSRMCLGMNLAYAELYIVLARIFLTFDLELHHTTRERDIDIVRHRFLGQPSKESKGVRVRSAQIKQTVTQSIQKSLQSAKKRSSS